MFGVARKMEDKSIKILTLKNLKESELKGKPPTRWLDDIEKDLNSLKIKNWREVDTNGGRWKERVLEIAKT
ncbi:hypothetical protein TNCV_1321741 [Trichonephila clavipes]|nr:hypothetical protein TNCV_1321741 [Trichonephila clavipes]